MSRVTDEAVLAALTEWYMDKTLVWSDFATDGIDVRERMRAALGAFLKTLDHSFGGDDFVVYGTAPSIAKVREQFTRAPVSVTNDPRVVELASLLRELLPYVATATLEHCSGNKCREQWCIGCCGEDEAIEAVTKARDASMRACAALANLEKKE